MSSNRIPVIGIVGGIGSGKSAVAAWVAEHACVSVIDADRLGHDALLDPSVKELLRQRFGSGILGTDGAVIRSELARMIFGVSSDCLAGRQDLQRIVHPEIERGVFKAVAAAAAARKKGVLLDAAILLETGWRNKCDLVVYIDTPDAVRLDRVRKTRGWSGDELRRRDASQWSLIEKRRESDLIITNDADIEAAGQQLLAAIQQRGWL